MPSQSEGDSPVLTEAISISEAFRAGANGYVLKQSASEELRQAIETVLDNTFPVAEDCARDTRGVGR